MQQYKWSAWVRAYFLIIIHLHYHNLLKFPYKRACILILIITPLLAFPLPQQPQGLKDNVFFFDDDDLLTHNKSVSSTFFKKTSALSQTPCFGKIIITHAQPLPIKLFFAGRKSLAKGKTWKKLLVFSGEAHIYLPTSIFLLPSLLPTTMMRMRWLLLVSYLPPIVYPFQLLSIYSSQY